MSGKQLHVTVVLKKGVGAIVLSFKHTQPVLEVTNVNYEASIGTFEVVEPRQTEFLIGEESLPGDDSIIIQSQHDSRKFRTHLEAQHFMQLEDQSEGFVKGYTCRSQLNKRMPKY
ncbi:hypothetical protein OnM2_043090, partial [Erysiphe neolycopersici]